MTIATIDMASVTTTLREKLQDAVDGGETLYRIAADTEISWNTLKRFLDGAGLRSEQIDKLATHFKLELQDAPDEKPKRKRKP